MRAAANALYYATAVVFLFYLFAYYWTSEGGPALLALTLVPVTFMLFTLDELRKGELYPRLPVAASTLIGAVYVVTSAVGGAMAGLAAALLSIQYSVHPHFGAAFGPITFMICVLGGLGNMVGAFIAAFVMSEIISVGGVLWTTEMGYVVAFALFIVMIFVRPGGILARRE